MRPLLVSLIFLSHLRLIVSFSPLDVEDFDGKVQPRPQLMLPINPYTSDVKLPLCNAPDELEQSKLLISELMTNEVAAAKIEAFSIDSFCTSDRESGCECSDLGPFVELIDRGGGYLKALKRVKWRSARGVHPPLLTSLEQHFPHLELSVDIPWGNPFGLRSSPLMHSLHVRLDPYQLDTSKTSPLLTHIQTQIMDSPNLVELSMKIGSMGCVISDVDPKFARLKRKRFPPLEKLTLEAFPLTVKNIDYWMKNMDWFQMGSLDFRDIDELPYFFSESMKLAGGLPQLKVLRMEIPWFEGAKDLREFEDPFLRFLDTPRDAPGLSEIALAGSYHPYLQRILDGHGTTLKKLKLHDPERDDSGPQREMLSELELGDLGRRAPNLEEISVDINHTPNGSLPLEFVDTLLSETVFPSLKTIELYGILGISDPTRVSRWSPPLTDQLPLISKLASRLSIDRVQLHVGESRRLTGGYPVDWVLWEQDNHEVWVAERDASGEMAVNVRKGWDGLVTLPIVGTRGMSEPSPTYTDGSGAVLL